MNDGALTNTQTRLGYHLFKFSNIRRDMITRYQKIIKIQ